MTRDFEIICNNKINYLTILDFLKNSKIKKNNKISSAFGHIDKINKKKIFASFIYDKNIDQIELIWKNKKIKLDKSNLNFIALKNGKHNTNGWAFGKFKKTRSLKLPIWHLSKVLQFNL